MSNPALASDGRMPSKRVWQSKSSLTSSRRIVIDITALDIQVIDDNGDVLRPFLTAAVDAETRCILGSEVSAGSPTSETMRRCVPMYSSSHKSRRRSRRAHGRSTR